MSRISFIICFPFQRRKEDQHLTIEFDSPLLDKDTWYLVRSLENCNEFPGITTGIIVMLFDFFQAAFGVDA